jgi:hypothetical protein
MTLVENRNLQFVDSLSLICKSPGPFLTVYLPAHRPGASDITAAIRLKTMLRSAAAELAQRRYQGPTEHLFAPFENLLHDPVMLGGSTDTVIFASPHTFHILRPPTAVDARLRIAAHPYITPLLPHVLQDRECYILLVSKKGLRLGRWNAGECREVALPASIPSTLLEAGNFGQPDHDLEGRSAAGRTQGQMHRVRFGTSGDDERADSYLHNYFRLADRELARFLNGETLAVIGVAEDLAAYRQASDNPRVLEAGHTGVDHLTWAEIGGIVFRALRDAQRVQADKVLGDVREATRRDHITSGVREVLEAARGGRVNQLILAREAEFQDLLGPLYPIAEAQIEGPQDLLNAAAVEAIRAGGEVYVVDAEQLAGFGPIAAILRYSPRRG